ncbi:MAG: glycosyltransferase family 1 protein, partial [Lentisphaerae bacterium]|nr:glycosyltransferase family 1 protein [Lentisphaerota bacterium]
MHGPVRNAFLCLPGVRFGRAGVGHGFQGAFRIGFTASTRGSRMRISFLGSRGIPARYSGFETFYEQLAVRLAARGHEVTVYNRSRFMGDVGREYRGVRIVSLPSVPTKHLDTITHTALSTAHLMLSRCDIAYYCIVGNSPIVWLPRLRGIPTVLNVDAADWAREKWGAFARWYQRTCERVATRTATILAADSRV